MTQKNNPLVITAIGLLIASNTVLGQNAEAESASVVESASIVDSGSVGVVGDTGNAVPVATQTTAENTELSVLAAEPINNQATTPSVTASVQGNSPLADTLSVDFPDEDIRNVLRNVADLFELNIIVPDALAGRTSIKLRDVTWRELFKVVLEPVGYTFVEERSIIKIVSRDALQLEPFETQSIILDNVPATSVEPILRPMLSPSVAATPATAARSGGTLVVNSLANEIIITDQPAVIRRMVETVNRMDSEPRQVVIETKFMEIQKADAKALGVQLAGTPNFGSSGGYTQSFVNSLGGTVPATLGASPQPNNVVLNGNDFSVLINALSSLTGTRIVSNPTIVAINGSRSQIEIGRDLQTITVTQQQSTGGGNNTVTASAGEIIFEGVRVEITPQITSSRLVALQITTRKTEAEEFEFQASADTSPIPFYNVRRREGTLNMILNDGQTAAIGGLMDRRERDIKTKVPVLGDIPLIGAAFRSKSKTVDDTNLVIFITASILEPSKTTYRNFATRKQLSELEVTPRDIEGVNYKPSAEEEALYDALKELRAKRQSAEIQQQLDAAVNPPPPKSSKR